MAVTASTMRCPVCDEETLQTLSTSFGTWERCARCFGIFIHKDLIASASADRAACVAALAETKDLLLPTDRACPKCLQSLFEGRVESRGVILSLCPTCESLWTTLPTLRQFEEAIEKRLAAETEASGVSSGESAAGGIRPSRFYEDTGMASFFRGFARLFDKVADSFRTDPEEKELLKEAKRLKKQKAKKEAKPEKLIQAVAPTPPAPIKETPKPAALSEPTMESPKIDVPQFIFPEGELVEEKPEPKFEPSPEPKPEPKPVPKEPEPIQYLKPDPVKEASKPVEKKPVIGGVGTPKPGFFAKLKAAWSPKPPATQQGGRAPEVWRSKAAKPPKAAEPPKAKPIEAPKPAKPAAAPKPKREKAPSEPFDYLAVWPPWILAIIGMVSSGLRDYGYETEPFILWGMMGWAIGMMIRAKRLYSSPVELKGQIILAREEDPKGPLVFKIDDKVYALNKLKRWDVIPRLFGLSNPRQLLKGEVTLTGWFREKLAPSIEVHEIRRDKAFRKSMTKTLRWVFPVLVFVVALGIYLSLD